MRYLYIEKRQRVKKEDSTELSRRATRIKEEMDALDIDNDVFHLDELSIQFIDGETRILLKSQEDPSKKANIEDYTHVIFGGHSLGTNEYELKKFIIKYIDEFNRIHPTKQIAIQNRTAMSKLPFYSKLDVAQICMDHNLPHLNTYYSTAGDYRADLGPLSYPIVAKHIDGENDIIVEDGKEKIKKNVFLVKDGSGWDQERLNEKDLSEFFIQEFTEIGEDYRIFLTRDSVIGGWKRISPEDNFITVSKGSEYHYYNKPDKEIMDICEKAREALEFDFLALDFIYKDGKPYILEFSLHPGFHAYETKCINGEPANIAKAIVEAI
jgi:hypothetical protein